MQALPGVLFLYDFSHFFSHKKIVYTEDEKCRLRRAFGKRFNRFEGIQSVRVREIAGGRKTCRQTGNGTPRASRIHARLTDQRMCFLFCFSAFLRSLRNCKNKNIFGKIQRF